MSLTQSVTSLFFRSQSALSQSVRSYYIQRGARGKISPGTSVTPRWTNVDGEVAFDRMLPRIMKTSRQKFPERHLEQGFLPALQPGMTNGLKSEESKAEERELAEVPHFARYAEFKMSDLDFTASPLHVIWRIKSLSGRPKWEKNIMRELKLNLPKEVMAVVKNTPDINWKLWQVKHLVQITPLRFPEGVPMDENDIQGFLLKRNGELVRYKLGRENYNRRRGRPEMEKYVLLRQEKEYIMRKKFFEGSLDGQLLNTLPTPWSGVNGERWE